MKTPSIQTLTFLFDNKTDHILLHRISEDGPLKGKHSGIKGEPGFLEDMNMAAIRSIQESTGLEVSNVVLRGVIKTILEDVESAVIYFVFESARFSGELQNNVGGRLQWIDILHIFNLEMESLVHELMPNLLDGESFFEGTLHLNSLDEVLHSEIHICNSI
jgi:ADP-ribose pyrophosphatase YjhB (NUDIX family)